MIFVVLYITNQLIEIIIFVEMILKETPEVKPSRKLYP